MLESPSPAGKEIGVMHFDDAYEVLIKHLVAMPQSKGNVARAEQGQSHGGDLWIPHVVQGYWQSRPFDRLSRYEATLCRQLSRILLALDALDRRKPQERRRASERTCME